ncbi:MAG: helix-turn-helix transcriptional regulator [Oscillospiraceae bacterium]|nr:helix-turn-helix transcriptional regulator [Oscillospiraceae bacterium]
MTLKELREKNKLSQAALAKSIGVSPSAVASIETGKLKPSQKIADAVKNVYGESIEVPAAKAKPAEKKGCQKSKARCRRDEESTCGEKGPC